MRTVLRHGLLALALALGACKSDNTESNPPDGGGSGEVTDAGGTGGAAGGTTAGDTGAGAATGGGAQGTDTQGGSQDLYKTDPNRFIAPEISHSKGAKGGVVLLYPRIIPASAAADAGPLATQVQQRLQTIVQRALPGRPVDVRPSPERVCPRGGCDGLSVNVVFSKNGNACLVVAVIGQPGESPLRLFPWAGEVAFKSDSVPFRDPPESQITVKDYVPCDRLATALGDSEGLIEAAIRSMAPAG